MPLGTNGRFAPGAVIPTLTPAIEWPGASKKACRLRERLASSIWVTIFVSYFIYRETTSMKSLRPVRGMYLTGLIFIIVAVAGLYAWLLTISGIAQDTVSLINGLHSERWVVLLVINVFLLFVGCFLDPASALIMLTPLLAPVAASLGINPIHFGCHRGAEPDYRNLSPPVRPEHLCHPSAVQNAVGNTLFRADTVRDLGGDRAYASDLCAGNLALDHASTVLTRRLQLNSAILPKCFPPVIRQTSNSSEVKQSAPCIPDRGDMLVVVADIPFAQTGK